MKRRIFSVLFALVLVLSFSLMTAVPVAAAGNNAKGAVKADLTVYQEAGGQLPKGTVVGSVILNTTANGNLIVVINMDAVPNIEDYDVRVWINYPAVRVPSTFVDVLNTNAKGNGNANVKVNVLSFIGSTIDVGVVLRPNFVDRPLATPCYTTDWPTQVTVPLK